MPYDEVAVDCSIVLCANNESQKCECECHLNELNPDNADCSNFEFSPNYFLLDVEEDSEIEEIKGLCEDLDVPFVSIDENSKHFQTVMSSSGNYCLVQGDEKDILEFRFWKNVDGGYGCTHRSQLELKF